MSRSALTSQILWVARVVVIWLSATLALSSIAIHSGNALRSYITPHYDGALIFVAAFVLALLVGLSVESPKWAVGLAGAMCLVMAAVYGGVIYAPVWLDIAVSTVSFQNYVSQQVLLVFFWSIIPALAGSLAGNFGGSPLRHRAPPPSDLSHHVWWERTPPE